MRPSECDKIKKMNKLYIYIYINLVMKIVFYIRFLRGLRSLGQSILFVDHFYHQDYEALSLVKGPLSVCRVEASSTFGLLRRVFKPEIKSLWKKYDEEDPFVLEQVSLLMSWLIDKICLKIELSAVMVPHDNYYWIREFLITCKRHKVSTIVLDKEGMISPYHFISESRRSREFAPPICDYVFVWSNRKKNYWIECGVPGEKIIVTGMARSDLLKTNSKSIVAQRSKKVTIFTYHLTAYIPHEEVAQGLTWEAQRSGMHRVIKQFATSHPEISYMLKCHPQQQDVDDIRASLRGTNNVNVIGGSRLAMNLISESDYVVCFQSTVMIEAMVLSKPIIYAGWSDLEVKLADKLLPFRNIDGIVYVDSEDDFEKALGHLNSEHPIKLYDSAVIDSYLYQPDGKTSERIMDLAVDLCKK